MAYTGRGTANEVLKATGPETAFGPISTGVTVASGSALSPNYNTVKAAIDAGETAMSVIGYTVETADISAAVASIVQIEDGAQWNLDSFTYSGTILDVRGNGSINYVQPTFDKAAFEATVNIDGLQISNLSSQFAPLTDGNNSRISNCAVIGDCVLSGSGVLLNSSSSTGSLIVMDGASGVNIQHMNVGGLAIDSGTATVMSNIRFN
jgi:hypothetical protein